MAISGNASVNTFKQAREDFIENTFKQARDDHNNLPDPTKYYTSSIQLVW